MQRFGRPIRLLGTAVLASWLVVGTALWLLSGPSSRDAVAISIAATVLLAVGLWRLSGRVDVPNRPSPTFLGAHALGGLTFGGVMIPLTYWVESQVRGETIGTLARAATSLGAEFVFWIWVYVLIAAVAHGSRLGETLRAQRETALATKASVAEAHLAALRGQLNPHFLFNALHGLTALVRHDATKAERALEQLGELLRFSLDEAAAPLVELAEELAFTRTYLDLERLALGDRLTVLEDVEASALDASLPPFSLQVLVENAIRHGVGPNIDGGQIKIRVRDHSDRIEVEVQDDTPKRAPTKVSTGGRGLSNLRDRLEVFYGPHACLEAGPLPERGYLARLSIPKS